MLDTIRNLSMDLLKPTDARRRAEFDKLVRKQRLSLVILAASALMLGALVVAGLPSVVLPYGGILLLIIYGAIIVTYEIKKNILWRNDLRDAKDKTR